MTKSKILINNLKTKKQKERDILKLIYNEKELQSIKECEEPDFILQKINNIKFGVEITEFYYSESSARINNIPNYMDEIINKNIYKHKDDINSFETKEFSVIRNGVKINGKIRGILQKQPSISKNVTKLSQLINNKNEKFNKYIGKLNHVNLIIYDYENILTNLSEDKIRHLFFKSELEKVIINSNFREIFFITKICKFNLLSTVYIPLKTLFLISEIKKLRFIMTKNYKNEIEKFSNKEPLFVVEYLRWRGLKNVSYRTEFGGYEIIYGNSGVLITEKNNKISIRDHNDFNISDCLKSKELKLKYFFDGKFIEHYKECCNKNTFVSRFYFPCKEFNIQ